MNPAYGFVWAWIGMGLFILALMGLFVVLTCIIVLRKGRTDQ